MSRRGQVRRERQAARDLKLKQPVLVGGLLRFEVDRSVEPYDGIDPETGEPCVFIHIPGKSTR